MKQQQQYQEETPTESVTSRMRLDTADTPIIKNLPRYPSLSRHASAPPTSFPSPHNNKNETIVPITNPGLVARQVSAPSSDAYVQQLQRHHQYMSDDNNDDDCIDCISVVSSLSMDDSQYHHYPQQKPALMPPSASRTEQRQSHQKPNYHPQPKQNKPQFIISDDDNDNVPPPTEVIVSTNEHLSLRVSGGSKNNILRSVPPVVIPTTIREHSRENTFDTIAPEWLKLQGTTTDNNNNTANDDNYIENCPYQPQAGHRRKSLLPPSVPRRMSLVRKSSGEAEADDEHPLPPPPPYIKTMGPSPVVPRPTLGSRAQSWTFSSQMNSSYDESGQGRQGGSTPRHDNNNNNYVGNEEVNITTNEPLAVKSQILEDAIKRLSAENEIMGTHIRRPSLLNRNRRVQSTNNANNAASIGSINQGYSSLITVPTTTTMATGGSGSSSIASSSISISACDSFKQAQRAQHKLLLYSGEEDGSACCRIHHEKAFYARKRGNFMKRIISSTTSSPKIPSLLKKNHHNNMKSTKQGNPKNKNKNNNATIIRSSGCLT